MKSEKIEAILAKWLEAWKHHDVSVLTSAFAEDAVYTSMLAGTIRGRGEIETLYHGWFKAFPDMVFEVERQLINGDQGAVLWSQYGTHVGSFAVWQGRDASLRSPAHFS